MIGDLYFDSLNTQGKLPCDGAMYPVSDYPELAEVCKKLHQDRIEINQTPFYSYTANMPAEEYLKIHPSGEYLVHNINVSPYLVRVNLTTAATSTPVSLPTVPIWFDFSPDGGFLAVGYNGSPFMEIYRTSDWSKLDFSPVGASMNFSSRQGKFSPDGTRLALCNYDDNAFVVVNMRNMNARRVSTTDPLDFTEALDFSPDGRYIAVAYDLSPNLKIFDVETLQEVTGLSVNAITDVKFSPDGRHLAVAHNGGGGGSYFSIISTANWGELAIGDVLSPTAAVEWTVDGNHIVLGTQSATPYRLFDVYQWEYNDIATIGEMFPAYDGPAQSGLQISPDGSLLAFNVFGDGFKVHEIKKKAPAGYFYVPNIPHQQSSNISKYPVLIQAEE